MFFNVCITQTDSDCIIIFYKRMINTKNNYFQYWDILFNLKMSSFYQVKHAWDVKRQNTNSAKKTIYK